MTLRSRLVTPVLSALLSLSGVLTGSTSDVARAAETPPAAPASTLPEIGRTRSSSPGCAALRDLVIPSFAAALRADTRFAGTQTRLPRYAEIAADETDHNSVFREAELSRLSVDSAFLLQETLVMKKALEDPRLSSSSRDPQIPALRAELETLYDAQRHRAGLLSEFVLRESTSLGVQRVGMEDGGGLDGKRRPQATSTRRQNAGPIIPATTAAPGMPVLTGLIPIADRARLAEWGNAAAVAVRDSENHAARVFLPLARECRDGSQ
jgi:hypothetical protein